jgi:hypothetical protein
MIFICCANECNRTLVVFSLSSLAGWLRLFRTRKGSGFGIWERRVPQVMWRQGTINKQQKKEGRRRENDDERLWFMWLLIKWMREGRAEGKDLHVKLAGVLFVQPKMV